MRRFFCYVLNHNCLSGTGHGLSKKKDSKTWLLHHFVLGIFQKEGTSKAVDVANYVQSIWEKFHLLSKDLVGLVTEMGPTMIAAGRLILGNAI